MSTRPVCPDCQRPRKTCLCAYTLRRRSDYPLVILQHPTEARHALSSAPLLARAIEGSSLVVGEVFDPELILGSQWRQDTLLVYPGENAVGAETLSPGWVRQLLLLDGTWRKVARLIYLNPWLKTLPCLALQPAEGSRYRIRKSPRVDGLATIEAGVAALNALHPGEDYRDILGAFHKMIELQLAAMDPAVARANYPE